MPVVLTLSYVERSSGQRIEFELEWLLRDVLQAQHYQFRVGVTLRPHATLSELEALGNGRT